VNFAKISPRVPFRVRLVINIEKMQTYTKEYLRLFRGNNELDRRNTSLYDVKINIIYLIFLTSEKDSIHMMVKVVWEDIRRKIG